MIENPEDQKVIEQTISVMKTIAPQFVDTIDKLRALLPPASADKHTEPERIGGLTIPEWKMLAKNNEDVLVEVRDGRHRYLKEIDEDGRFICWIDGYTSKTSQESKVWSQCRLIEDTRWRLNPGYQPVPDGVEVEVDYLDEDGLRGKEIMMAKEVQWDAINVFLTYRILGVKE